MSFFKSSGNRFWRIDVGIAVVWLVTAMPAGEIATLVRVVDGDTIWVKIHNAIQSVRYLGINAEEWDTACGKVATRVNRSLLEGKTLRLVADADVSNKDRFGRLLRYVYAGDTLVNAELVRQGVAHARRYEWGIDHYPAYARLYYEAQAAQRGCL